MNISEKKTLDYYQANKEKFNTPYYEQKRKEFQKEFLTIKTQADFDAFCLKWQKDYIGLVPYTDEMLELRYKLIREGIK